MGKKCHKLKLYYLASEIIAGSSGLDFPNGSKLFNRECPIYGSTPGSQLFSDDTTKIKNKKVEGTQTIYIPGMGSMNYFITVDYVVNSEGVSFIPAGKTYVYQIVSGTEKFLGVKGTITTFYGEERREVTVRYYK